jgi:putative spermidine/putrescine transport system permease protein
MARVGLTAATTVRAARPARLRRLLYDWLPALPLIAVLAALILAPTLGLVVSSVTRDGQLTLANWIDVLSGRRDQQAIVNTLVLASWAATISTLAGAPLAWLISRMLPIGRAAWLSLLNVAANIGGIALGFGFLAAFGTFGMVTLVLHGVGIAWQPPDTTSFEGLLLGYLYTNIPLYVLLTLPAMGILRDDWWEAAQVAAATRWTFWRRVGLPVLTPFIAAGWLLIFTWSIGIYALAYALAGTGGADRFPLITLRIGRIIQGDVFTPWRGHVLAVVLMIIAIVALTTYRRLLRRALRWF